MAKLEYVKPPVEPSFWFLDAGLYHSEDYKFKDEYGHRWTALRENILSVIFPKITIDVYCPSCKRETVFNPVERENDWFCGDKKPVIKNGVQYAHFYCSRKHCGSSLYFVFRINNGILTKIGQFPSIADLISPEIKKYGAVLDSNLISDWQRAVGLRAHGIGAGSYVYLRRIIENIINDASEIALKDGKIQKEEYSKSRWPEKIKMLSEYLPNYLVENAKVYGVLSKGVHELSEEECSDFFDVMHTSIEIICEEKLADLERDRKAKAGAKALQKVLQKINEKDA
jgi:hypothetical protein